jgi:hypothetical protein
MEKIHKSLIFNDKIWHSTPFVAPLIVFDRNIKVIKSSKVFFKFTYSSMTISIMWMILCDGPKSKLEMIGMLNSHSVLHIIFNCANQTKERLNLFWSQTKSFIMSSKGFIMAHTFVIDIINFHFMFHKSPWRLHWTGKIRKFENP